MRMSMFSIRSLINLKPALKSNSNEDDRAGQSGTEVPDDDYFGTSWGPVGSKASWEVMSPQTGLDLDTW